MSLISRFDFPSSLYAGTVTVAVLMIIQPAVLAAKSPEQIAQIADSVTVQVNPPVGVQDGGSGVIIKRQGNTYTVLTCNHVAKMPGAHTIRTNDGKSYPVTNEQSLQTSSSDLDLALLTFNSSVNYPVATLAKSEVIVGSQIFVVGYPALDEKFGTDREFVFSPGYVTSRPHNVPEGYNLRYNSVTKGGMSGGAVFDVDGRVIGIHGQGVREKVAAQEGAKSSPISVEIKTGFNGAIPITTFLAMRSQVGQDTTDVAVDNAPSTDKPTQRLNNPQSASDFLAKGLVEREQGDKSEAVNAYTQAIKRDPNYADAYYQRGNTRYEKGDKQGAIEDYTKAISVNPDYALAYYQRGATRYNQGDKQGALADFDRYLSLVPNDTDGYYSRAVTRRALGDTKGTFTDFDQVVRLAPDDAKAYYNRGLARVPLRDPQGTLEDLNQAIKLDPKWTVAYNNRAIYRRRLGDREGAIADFSQVISLNPKDAIAYFNRGLVRRDMGDGTGAIADLQSAADLFQQKGDRDNYYKAVGKIQDIQGTLKDTIVQPLPESAASQSQPSNDASRVQPPTPKVDSSW